MATRPVTDMEAYRERLESTRERDAVRGKQLAETLAENRRLSLSHVQVQEDERKQGEGREGRAVIFAWQGIRGHRGVRCG